MKFLKWFSKKPSPEQRRIQLVTINSSGIRLSDWRNDHELVSLAHRVQSTSEFKAMIDILKTESPANFTLAFGTNLNDRAATQSSIEGYNLCLNNLSALAIPKSGMENLPEATFADENKE